ncbi:uncharacterized protein Dana_GF27206 [Drosophila ananassae]|uniref:RING-type domain-containing protein n=1 Tax=Drosophila ananassae TaxID=7217 RepID=A0A0P8ZDQ3_DROAN|nr:LON peptidase N-terminal domain and RING finger protein 3 [Drosophila ananassae]KPU72675.1 uncharacterized protein Dana_GF27206 [Drosophila ananassae]
MSNSRKESGRQGARSNTVPTASSLSAAVSQLEAEVDRINRFFESLVAGNVHEVSFALDLGGRERARTRSSRRAADGIVPEEIIDFSEWEPVPEVPLHRGSGRYFTPDAIIDLSEPHENSRSNSRHRRRRRRLADEILEGDAPETRRSRSRSGHRRRRRNDEPNAEEVIDVNEVATPPKRPREEEMEEEEEEGEPGCYKCPVCLGCARGHEPVATKCGHIFCRECLEHSLQKVKRCPICFTRLTRRQYMRIYI